MKDRLEELLLNADGSAPRHELRAPSLADLEARRRQQIVRRTGGVALVVLLVAFGLWSSALRSRQRGELLSRSAASLDSSLGQLGDALASLRAGRETRETAASEASEEAAMATFRALHCGADRGDAQSIEGMRWLAERFSTTQGGRCAQLFLAEGGPRSGAVPTEPYSTKPQPTTQR